MTIKIKICGITNLEDALDAIELGADYLGFNFYPDSPRYIEPKKAAYIFDEIPFSVSRVGVFVNEEASKVIDLSTELNLDLLQFHGDETPEYCSEFARPVIRVFRPQSEIDLEKIRSYDVDYLLVDAYVKNSFGGTGVISNWDLARSAAEHRPLFLAGGLTADNVEIAIASVSPFAVDVASGVEESPGKKDYRKMEEFIKKARRAGNMRVVK